MYVLIFFGIPFLSPPDRSNDYTAKNVQEAIEESKSGAIDNDLDNLNFGSTGQITDAYLESFFNVTSLTTPEPVAYDVKIRRYAWSNQSDMDNVQIRIYKISADRLTTTLIVNHYISGYQGYYNGELDIVVNAGWGLAVRLTRTVGPKPSNPFIRIAMAKTTI